MTTTLYSVLIRTEEDVVTARRIAREIAASLDFDPYEQTRIATAVSEIARNAFLYGGGGQAEFLADSAKSRYSVRITDKGRGIANLKEVLSGAYQSPSGLGLGIVGARRLMDDFRIESQPGKGTTVVLSKNLPGRSKLTNARMSGLASQMVSAAPPNMLDVLRQENQELLRVTEELRARQDDLSRLNAELEDTNRGVVALYAELDEKAEHLRRADQMKSRFLSHMSHEFRTPLTSILALSRLLLDEADGPLTPEQQKQTTFIRRSAENLLEMVNDLLDLARVEAGKSVVRPSRFQVSSMFGALRGVLRPLLLNEAVDLVFEDASGIPMLETDESKIGQILRNYVSNALKFTERGEVRVSALLSPDGERVIFTVTDTGIGIAPEHRELIFQEFAQIDTPLQSRVNGTGLGLPLSKALAELLGGTVRVESTVGKGSAFFAEIPVVYRGSEAIQPAAPAGCDALLIDDEDVSRYLIRQCLGSKLTVLEASDGNSGLELARKHIPSTIFLDLRMPGMSGFEVLTELKADSTTRRIPVIIMTSKSLSNEERTLLSANAVAVFSKDMLTWPDAGDRIRAAMDGTGRASQKVASRQ